MNRLTDISSKNGSLFSRIRRMHISDQEICLNIQKLTFPDARNYPDFAKELRKNHSIYLVTYFDLCSSQAGVKIKSSDYLCECSTNANNISGFIGGWRVVDQIQIIDFVVAPEFRKLRIGWLLLASLIKEAEFMGSKLITLEVRASNNPAINLYKKFGFEICGNRKNYYSNKTEDAILMSLDLTS